MNKILISCLIISLFSCTKEIKVVKGPIDDTTSYQGYALFTTGAPIMDDAFGIASGTRLYALDSSGNEIDIKKENGSPFENIEVRSVKPVKSGLIFVIAEQEYDSVMDTTSDIDNIYYTSDGKVAKKISSNNYIYLDYGIEYNKPESSNGFEYFCTSNGVSEWNDSSKELTLVHPLSPGSGCYGIQFGDDFLAVINQEMSRSKIIQISHKDPSGINLSTVRDLADVSDFSDGGFSGLTKVGDEILIIERYRDLAYNNVAKLIKINKNTGASSVILDSEDVPDADYNYYKELRFLFKGKEVGGKIYFSEDKGIQSNLVELKEESTQEVLSTSEYHQISSLYSYDKNSGLVKKSQNDLSFGFLSYMKSGDSVYTLVAENKGYFINSIDLNDGYYIKNSIKLYNETMESLVYDFGTSYSTRMVTIQEDSVLVLSDKATHNATNQLTTVYSLPKYGVGILSDSRFSNKDFSILNFTNFYDKTIVEYAERPEVGSSAVVKVGIFGNNGVLQLLQKENIRFNNRMMVK